MSAPNLKSRSVVEILDASFKLYRENFATFLGILAVIYVPLILLQIILQGAIVGQAMAGAASVQGGSAQATAVQMQGMMIQFVSLMIVIGLLYMIAQPVAKGALTFAIGDRYLDRRTSIGSCYGRIWGLFFRLLGAVLLSGLVMVVAMVPGFILMTLGAASGTAGGAAGGGCLGMVSALVLGLLFYAWFIFAPSACVLENLGPVASLGRSRQLARGNFWRIIGLVVLIIIINLLILLPVNFVLGMAFDPMTSGTTGLMLNQAIQGAIKVILEPFFVIALVLLYYDIRIRREAFDLEVLATAMGGGATPKPGADGGAPPEAEKGEPPEPAP